MFVLVLGGLNKGKRSLRKPFGGQGGAPTSTQSRYSATSSCIAQAMGHHRRRHRESRAELQAGLRAKVQCRQSVLKVAAMNHGVIRSGREVPLDALPKVTTTNGPISGQEADRKG